MSARDPAPAPTDGGVRFERPPRPHALATVLLVMGISLRRGLRGKRLLAVLGITVFPALLSLLVSRTGAGLDEQAEFFYSVLSTIHLVIVIPCVALTLATAFPWPEAEEGTLTYWFTTPAWRWAVHLGRYLASVVLGWALLPIAFLGLYLPLSAPPEAELWQMTWNGMIVTWLAFPAYLGIFGLVATIFRKGVVFGVVFIVLENSLALFQGNIQKLTVVYYMRAFLWKSVPSSMRSTVTDWFITDPQAPLAESSEALVMFATVPVVTLALALVAIHLIEYRAKQGQSA
jgi:ABC-type transport system involved in multi-copper enzyme maturation permease subunit